MHERTDVSFTDFRPVKLGKWNQADPSYVPQYGEERRTRTLRPPPMPPMPPLPPLPLPPMRARSARTHTPHAHPARTPRTRESRALLPLSAVHYSVWRCVALCVAQPPSS